MEEVKIVTQEDQEKREHAANWKKKDAATKLIQPPVTDVWYEWVIRASVDPKRGRKLVMKERTENGTMSTYVGHEKRMPSGWLKKQRAAKLVYSGPRENGMLDLPKKGGGDMPEEKAKDVAAYKPPV